MVDASTLTEEQLAALERRLAEALGWFGLEPWESWLSECGHDETKYADEADWAGREPGTKRQWTEIGPEMPDKVPVPRLARDSSCIDALTDFCKSQGWGIRLGDGAAFDAETGRRAPEWERAEVVLWTVVGKWKSAPNVGLGHAPRYVTALALAIDNALTKAKYGGS